MRDHQRSHSADMTDHSLTRRVAREMPAKANGVPSALIVDLDPCSCSPDHLVYLLACSAARFVNGLTGCQISLEYRLSLPVVELHPTAEARVADTFESHSGSERDGVVRSGRKAESQMANPPPPGHPHTPARGIKFPISIDRHRRRMGGRVCPRGL